MNDETKTLRRILCCAGKEYVLTHYSWEGDALVRAGLPSYVIQEEFHRYDGYWWRPTMTNDGVCHILYEEVDETGVETYKIGSGMSPEETTEEQRFPRAGSRNARFALKVLRFHLPFGNGKAEEDEEREDDVNVDVDVLTGSLELLFPWAEYLIDANWTPDGSSIWVKLLDRKQRQLEGALLPLETFSLPSIVDEEETETESSLPDPLVFLHLESPTSYLNSRLVCPKVDGVVRFIESWPRDIIYSTEQSGYQHLYFASCGQENSVRTRQLTKGPWVVMAEEIWVDEEKNLIYFLANKDTPLEKHLYVASYLQESEPVCLTQQGLSHHVFLDKGCRILVSSCSRLDMPPLTQVFRILSSKDIHGITIEPVGQLLPSPDSNAWVGYTPPEVHACQISSGETLYALFFPPRNLVPGQKYPVILNVYGGPKVQIVTNSFKGRRELRNHVLASMGYCVVCIDGRGSANRGFLFESHIFGRLGLVELDDQVEVLSWLADQNPYMDMNRVAIHGWSYGGYISLMALVSYPHVFKVSVAAAPVTSWRLYDTGYTERYIDLPQANPDGYDNGSVLSHVHKFPEE
ncbi:unnamed protein product [Darwinula stevensoni]|uniref:Dipeptidyl peptidase 8 n=1 Tax=Darwinula stevensoni TaxID=69355 RepID=A0A7R9ACK7_9CRUS|nr:unnamed protein product [Darwinula stevensoni]CAG0900196.1 unnamed protein product [Darwinula stevensoni]